MKPKKAAIYTRVSTSDQHPEIQERELVRYVKRRGWTIFKIYTDRGISGVVDRRPALDALLRDCRKEKISAVCVWKFDRFARSLRQLLDAFELFRALRIAFVSCTEAIDTSLPHGEMMFSNYRSNCAVGTIADCRKSKSWIAARTAAGQATGATIPTGTAASRNHKAQERPEAEKGAFQRASKKLWGQRLDSSPLV